MFKKLWNAFSYIISPRSTWFGCLKKQNIIKLLYAKLQESINYTRGYLLFGLIIQSRVYAGYNGLSRCWRTDKGDVLIENIMMWDCNIFCPYSSGLIDCQLAGKGNTPVTRNHRLKRTRARCTISARRVAQVCDWLLAVNTTFQSAL